jgi:hypothetical protein
MSRIFQIAAMASVLSLQVLHAQENRFTVVPFEFDPFNTRLVAAEWQGGLGCPTQATTVADNPATPGVFDPIAVPFANLACPTGDDRDQRIEGLMLAKTGPTANIASSGAVINGVKGIVITELGFDIRKSAAPASPMGSHCGAGAPRFNVITSDGVTHFVGCASPVPIIGPASTDWTRLRYNPLLAFPPILPIQTVDRISIVFDEGSSDTGPDFFGLAVLDNIDINGVLVGQGPRSRRE